MMPVHIESKTKCIRSGPKSGQLPQELDLDASGMSGASYRLV